MKNLFLGVLLLSSFNISASTCDLTQIEAKRDEINEIFDNAQMNGEDHVIALMELDRKEGALALSCIKNGVLAGLKKSSLNLAREAAQKELAEELRYLDQMEAHYFERGQYLDVELVREEKFKVKRQYQDLIEYIDELI